VKALTEYLWGIYSIRIYIPFSRVAKRFRDISRKIRGKTCEHTQITALQRVSWNSLFKKESIRLVETKKENGNVRISELGIISLLAKRCQKDSIIFEIGTFDGRTTLNLAINSLQTCKIYTLDLPQNKETKFNVEGGEKHFIDKQEPGLRYKSFDEGFSKYKAKITQLLGDSATFDFSPFENKCGLVFVDGSHAYEYACVDSYSALKMVKDGGIVIWHDYGVWRAVTQALEELEEKEELGLRHIAGTSLVYWKAPTKSS